MSNTAAVIAYFSKTHGFTPGFGVARLLSFLCYVFVICFLRPVSCVPVLPVTLGRPLLNALLVFFIIYFINNILLFMVTFIIIFSNLTFNAWNVHNNNCNDITDVWRQHRLNKDIEKQKEHR